MQQKQNAETDAINTMRSELERTHKDTAVENGRSDYRWLAYVGLSAIGGMILWANRQRISSFLRSQGITSETVSKRAQEIKHSIGEAVQSGISKVAHYAGDTEAHREDYTKSRERFESNSPESTSGTSQAASKDASSRILHS